MSCPSLLRSMASIFRSSKLASAICFVLVLALCNGIDGILEREFLAMVSGLRSRGYNLFGNALITSDIHYEILSGSSFTFFAPTDSALYDLDLTTPASYYVETLQFHVVPGRFSMSFLRSLPSGSSLSTLVPHHHIFISDQRMPRSNLIRVNSVDVVFPGLFSSRHIAVHGLNSIMILHYNGSNSLAKSTVNDTNTFSPIMKFAGLDSGISRGVPQDCVPVVRHVSPPEIQNTNPPDLAKMAQIPPDCMPIHHQFLSDTTKTPTAKSPEKGIPVNLEGPLSRDSGN